MVYRVSFPEVFKKITLTHIQQNREIIIFIYVTLN